MNKIRDLQEWFINHVEDDGKKYTLDKNQAKVILDCHKNTIVTARAGSGKTRTIVAKVIYLLKHEHVRPEEIVVFSFNRKARAEINERLTKISFDHRPIFEKTPKIATTFHAFAYNILGGKEKVGQKLLTEEEDLEILRKIVQPKTGDEDSIPRAKQFITRAEQQFSEDFKKLKAKIEEMEEGNNKEILQALYQVLEKYKNVLKKKDKTNFNEMMSVAARKIVTEKIAFPFRYIFVDEYQDFSKLFLNLVLAIRTMVPDSHLLVVGDDWQAINRFAGSDVDYFINFQKYFPENSIRLFIPTNYRSGKLIVRNANYFMSRCVGDYRGCKAGNKKKAQIFIRNVMFKKYEDEIRQIISNNPGKTIKLLDRNNNLNFRRTSLTDFTLEIQKSLPEKTAALISESTIHRSKGLESDIVILLEIDAEKFPGKDKNEGLYEIFGDSKENLFRDEARLFYVALTRPKEKLYILSKTTAIRKETKKYNFISYLNPEWYELS